MLHASCGWHRQWAPPARPLGKLSIEGSAVQENTIPLGINTDGPGEYFLQAKQVKSIRMNTCGHIANPLETIDFKRDCILHAMGV
jgi:hypothetical protein